MSYTVEKKGGKFCVVNSSDGSTYKEFDTRREAIAELKVVMAKEDAAEGVEAPGGKPDAEDRSEGPDGAKKKAKK